MWNIFFKKNTYFFSEQKTVMKSGILHFFPQILRSDLVEDNWTVKPASSMISYIL